MRIERLGRELMDRHECLPLGLEQGQESVNKLMDRRGQCTSPPLPDRSWPSDHVLDASTQILSWSATCTEMVKRGRFMIRTGASAVCPSCYGTKIVYLCPQWNVSGGQCCPDGAIEPDCPGCSVPCPACSPLASASRSGIIDVVSNMWSRIGGRRDE